MTRVEITINGSLEEIDAPAHERLLTTLRERSGLTGAKHVCGRGECGACTVLLDGTAVYSCLTLTVACAGRLVTTIEGLTPPSDDLHPLQRAFIDADASQCGFCTPGQILAAASLLARNPSPTEPEIVRAMSGNLCRCGTYPKIIRAVANAARTMAAQESDPHG